MSYILDALRRADAERERGGIPGLHTQAGPAGAPEAEADRRPLPWMTLMTAAVVVLLATVGWLLWRSPANGEASPQAPRGAALQSAPPVVVAALPPAPQDALPAPAAPTPGATPAIPVAPPTGSRSAAPADRTPAAKSPAAGQARDKPAASRPSKAAGKGKQNERQAAETAADPDDGRIYAMNELPDEIRRGLPRPTVGGSVYSRTPASRMLVINGQVFREGDTLGPSLQLVRIRQKSAILEFKGFRYELPF